MTCRKRNNKGFTLVEVMIAVAVMAIVGAVATVSVSAYVRHSEAVSRNTIAEQAYDAMQDKLSMERILGKLDEYTSGFSSSPLTDIDSIISENFTRIESGSMTQPEYLASFHEAHGTDSLYYFTADGGDRSNAFVSFLFDALGDESVYDMDYVVEYNKKTGRVMSVFCSGDTELSYSTNLINRDSSVLASEKIGYHGIYWTADNAPFTESAYLSKDKGIMTNGVYVPDGTYAAEGSTVTSELTFLCDDKLLEKYPIDGWIYTVSVGDGSGAGYTSEEKTLSSDTTADMNSLYESIVSSAGADKAPRYLYMYLEQNGYKAGYYDTDAVTDEGEACKERHLLFLLDNPVTSDSWGSDLNSAGIYGDGDYYCNFTVSYGDRYILNYDCDDIGSGTKLFNPLFDHYDSTTDTYYITSPRHLSNMRYGKPDGNYVISGDVDFTDIEKTATYLARDTEVIAGLPAGSRLTANAVSDSFTPLSWKDSAGNPAYFSGSLSASEDTDTERLYSINGMKISDGTNSYSAMFPYMVSGAKVHDLVFTECSTETTGNYAAILCGQAVKPDISNIAFMNCSVSASDHVALLAGILKETGTVNNILVDSGNVTGTSYTAGLIGEYQAGPSDTLIMTNIKNGIHDGADDKTGASVNGTDHAAGIIGKTTGSLSIKDVCNTGEVQGSTFVGGIFGEVDGTDGNTALAAGVENYGNVTGSSDYVGGIAGKAEGKNRSINVTMTDLSNAGIINNTGSYTGGITGHAKYVNLGTKSDGYEGCTNTGSVTGHDYTGGIAGRMEGYLSRILWFETDYYAHVRELSSTGNISGNNYVGGLSGYAYELYVEKHADATGTVSGSSNKMRCLGWHDRVVPNNTLPAFTSASASSSDIWLGGIARNKIESVTFTDDCGEHSTDDSNCSAVSTDGYENCIEWHEDTDNDGLYEMYVCGYDYEWAPFELESGQYYFSDMDKLQSVDFRTLLHVKSSCHNMFDNCSGLTSLDLSSFDTSNVTDMGSMFEGCSGLTSLDLSGFDTSNVTGMGRMFFGCSGLTSLDVSGFDTSNVTSMYYMFFGCSGLTSLDVSNFDTSNVTDMGLMFSDCSGLTSLDVSGFDTSKVTKMYSMFDNCSGLTSLDVSGFNTSKVTGMGSMFEGCSGLTSLDVSGFDTSKVTGMGFMFEGCSGLTSLDVSGFNTSKVTYMYRMFFGCISLTSLDVSGFDTSNVTDMGSMFEGCSGLTSLDVSGFDTSNVTDMGCMFIGCSGLTSLDVSGFDTSKVTKMYSMFEGCSGLTSLDVSGFNTSKVTKMYSMFDNCSGLTSLDVSGFDTSNVTDMDNMFYNCSGLTSLDLSGFDTSNVTNMYSMFSGCNSLSKIWVPAIIAVESTLPSDYGKAWYGYDAAGNYLNTTYTTLPAAKSDGAGKLAYISTEKPKAVLATYGDTTYFFGKSNDAFKRSAAETITFDDSGTYNGTGALASTDVSEAQDGRIMMYATDTDGNGKYELTISADEEIFMNSDSSNLFTSASSLTAINGLDKVNTSDVTYMYSMFEGCISLTSLDVSGFDTSNVTYMYSMFEGCSGLTSLDVSGFDTSNVTYMFGMFDGCSGLTSLDVSGFDTSKVTNMGGMFSGCSGLTILDVSGFDTSKVTKMYSMFSSCSGLTSLDVSGFDTSKVTNMGGMFSGCSGLTILDVSGFDTSKVTKMYSMFSSCSGLTSLDVSNFDTSKVTNMFRMFDGCSGLTSLDLSGFDTSNVTDMDNMFKNCISLTSLDVSGFNTSNVTDMGSMFYNCSGLTSLDVSGFDTSNVTDMFWMFKNCSGLTSLDVSGFNTSNVTDMGLMFYNCSGLTSLDVSGFDTSNVTDMYYMFEGCSSLTSLDLSGFDTSNVTDMYYMFEGCSSLTSLDVSGFDTSKVTKMYSMFEGCSGLTSLDVSGFDTSNVTGMGRMFFGCSGLTSLDLSGFDTSNVTDMGSMFEGCSGLTSLDVSGFNTSNVTGMGRMFFGCSGLTSLDVSGFDTSNVTGMFYMFEGCSGLTSLDVSGFDTSKVTGMGRMFFGCSGLTSLDLSGFDTSKVTKMYYMFEGCSSLTVIYAGNGWVINSGTDTTSMFGNCGTDHVTMK